MITRRVTPRPVHACNTRDSFGREQAGSSNLRGDIASITSFIRETCRMERRAVEVTVGESTRCALHARASSEAESSAAWLLPQRELDLQCH